MGGSLRVWARSLGCYKRSLGAFYATVSVLHALCALSHLSLSCRRHCYHQFTEDEAEDESSWVICPWSVDKGAGFRSRRCYAITVLCPTEENEKSKGSGEGYNRKVTKKD